MPELRKDPITGRWVIIATERAKRPMDFVREKVQIRGSGFCPFCYNNESKTPPEILAYRPGGTPPNTPGWTLRVVSNKFPALTIEGNLNRQGEGLYSKMEGIGAHEVIIETPDHQKTLAELSPREIEDVLWAFRDRILDLKKDSRFKYILIFKNHGEAAGASLEHTHSQLIALPVVPKRVAEEMEGALKHYEDKERCIYCDIINQEKETEIRIIAEDEAFIAISPFAPRFPFETWILPKSHQSAFEQSKKQEYAAFASMLKDILTRLDQCLENPAYNYIIHTSPLPVGSIDYYHWHMEIMPKLTKVAGFEWGTGFHINPTPPEISAKFLREAAIPAAVTE
ncbi:MAG: galactose-1-phosphate uridylyltransferase [Acidobacteriota bacterium]|nr:galactose-1-phosphate uridylyltransferase [Acidobacteriota bacterium]